MHTTPLNMLEWPSIETEPLESDYVHFFMQVKFLWGEVACHIVWLLNMTPFEAAFGKKLDLKNVREWGEGLCQD